MNTSGNSPGGRPGISVFFPAYNDAENLRVQIPRTIEIIQQLTSDFEIIVVDDGSTDETSAVLETLIRACPALSVIRHRQNLGYGAALQDGFMHATKELIFYTDGDCQYDVSELTKLWEKLNFDVDVVTGYKIKRADTVYRDVVGRIYRTIVGSCFRLKVRDVDCDFRLIRRKVMKKISLTSRTGAICVDLMCQIERGGWKVIEVPVNHYPRLHGKSQFFRIGPITWTLLDLLRLWIHLILLKRRSSTTSISPRSEGVR